MDMTEPKKIKAAINITTKAFRK